MKYIATSLLLIIVLFQPVIAQTTIPKYEFRGAWVATVANIDWPKNRNAASGEQINELVTIFDRLEKAGINAVIFQVRTECDALYNSYYEPWSRWLTGEQGKSPSPYYDPLEFAISEAHRRGMELHAWLNPYRSVKNVGDYKTASNHVSELHPEWILEFGKYKMLDPGNPAVKDYILKIVTDIITRYDIDGLHFDDYFYPYSPKVSTEDAATFRKYNAGFTDIDEWRRYNVNSLMASIYNVIKVVNPRIKFGISPFGIVENKYAGTQGLNSFSVLYCDPLTWIKDKTVDYVNPQLYWEMDHDKAAYRKLLPWWASVTKDVHLYIGHFSSRFFGRRQSGNKDELGNQLRMNRETPNVHGSVFFSSSSITAANNELADTLKNNFYSYPALTPLMPWKESIPPLSPVNVKLTKDSISVILTWDKPEPAVDGEVPHRYIIYKFSSEEDLNKNNPENILEIVNSETKRCRVQLKNGEKPVFVIASLDRLNNECTGVVVKVE